MWSPDGSELIYSSDEDGSDDLYRKAADGSGDAVQITHHDFPIYVSDWSADGRYVLATRIGQADEEAGWEGGAEIGVIDLEEGDGTLRPFLTTTFDELEAAFSPDGRWVAYQSNESGQNEIYVRPFTSSGRWQVSDDGGSYARFSADGSELFYRTNDGVGGVDVETSGDSFTPSRPRLVASGDFKGGVGGIAVGGNTFADYDVAPDGRFVMFPSAGSEEPNIQLANIVVNWFGELQRVAPRR